MSQNTQGHVAILTHSVQVTECEFKVVQQALPLTPETSIEEIMVWVKFHCRNEDYVSLTIAPISYPKPATSKCQIDGCTREGLCSSGNAGGRIVCRAHFRIYNGQEAS